jgi:hypothetical protein
MGISLREGSVGQTGEGTTTGDFVIWLKGALGVERLTLWELCEGNLEWGSLAGDPEGYVETVLETGISSHRGTALGNVGRAARKPDTQLSTPHCTDNLKTKHQIRQAATTCIIF